MASVSDNPFTRKLRNFTSYSFAGIFLLAFAYLGIGVTLIFLIAEPESANKFLTYNFDRQISTAHQFTIKCWIYYLDNISKLGFSSLSYFVPKLFLGTLSPSLFISSILWFFRQKIINWQPFKEPESIHGDAHWASAYEVKKMGLRAKTGVLLGNYKNEFLIAGDYQHILLFAPTGSGKGVGFVVPNLLFWLDSVIVHDIKLENYELTSGWRRNQLKQKVFLWNPADPDGISHCYNPMDWISKKPGQMVDDVQKICNFLLPKQEFWSNEARALLTGIMLYLVSVEGKLTTLGEVVRTLRNDDVVYNLAVVLDAHGKKIHPVAYMNIASYLQKPDKERGSVTSTANSALELWANPLIDATTATSDFNLHEFKISPHTLYVGLTPDNLSRLKPLMGMFYQQAAAFFTAHIPRPEEKYGVLMMMDEFPTLGKMEQFLAGIAYFRGYKVRLFLIIQDTEQLKGIYEESGMNSFLSNSTYRITFAANNVQTANLISQMIGNKTTQQISFNRPKYLDLNPGSRSLHLSDIQRALILPQEVIALPREEQILLIESQPPVRCKKIRYFEDPFFTQRLLPKTEIPKQLPFVPTTDSLKSKKPNEASPGLEQPIPETANAS